MSKPTAEVRGVRFGDVSFEKLGLLFDVVIENPNPVGVSVAGLDYRFSLDGRDLLDGSKADALKVPARGSGTTVVPVSIDFLNLSEVVGSLEGKDTLPYEFAATLQLDIPVLGSTPIPLDFVGELPVIRPPVVSISGVEKTRFDLTGAGLVLRLSIGNPNAFSLVVDGFQYSFGVNDRAWIESRLSSPTSIGEKATAEIAIPMEVSFLKIGMTAYQILAGREKADYSLSGAMELSSSLPFLQGVVHDFQKSGNLSVR